MTEALIQEKSGSIHEYPRPQLIRPGWIPLNGTWDFAMDRDGTTTQPEQITWDRTICVPFSPETEASGIKDTTFYRVVWYRRRFERPKIEGSNRLILHFGAVDYHATVWVNGCKMCTHEGAYAPFSVDITDVLRMDGELKLEELDEIILRAEDDPADLAKPRGKQDWKLEPHAIWYPRTTGIWQTVWMELAPATFVESIYWTANLERWEIGMEVRIGGVVPEGATLAVYMEAENQLLANDTYSVVAGEVNRRIALSDPGIDDYRNTLLWSPSSPTIVNVQLELRDNTGVVIDSVESYTALRSIGTQGDRFVLNGRPLALRMVLDQGYWPETGLTAPNDEAFLKDVLLIKSLGFNGVRKHQKIEDPRFLYWADHLGLLVWEEMPSAYRYTVPSVERVTTQWIEILKRDRSHPCIVTWVPFNESWGVPDLPDSPAQRHYVQALYYLTKTIDPTRLVIGNDGWESVATDILGIHDYDSNLNRMEKRYGMDDLAHLLTSERPGGRMLLLGDAGSTPQPIVLTEFGGIAISDSEKKTWGYSTSQTTAQFLERYSALLTVVRELPALAGFCYTQFADTYQEANGLVYADRTPKAPVEDFALATTGWRAEQDDKADLAWRRRIMHLQRRLINI